LVIAGLLIGIACVISPTVHNYYHLLLLPLVAALIDFALWPQSNHARWELLLPLLVFTVVDLVFPLPHLTYWLRDRSVPLLSLLYLLGTGVWVLVKHLPSPPSPDCGLAESL